MNVAAAVVNAATPPSVPASHATQEAKPLQTLLRAMSLQHEQKCVSTLWIPRVREVHLEFALDKLTVLAADKTKHEALPWADVLGAHILNEDGEHLAIPVDVATVATAKTYVFALFAYTAKYTRPGKLKHRQLREWYFRFPGHEMGDLVTLMTWVNYLADPRSTAAVAAATKLDDVRPVVRTNRKFYVILNPVGGAGKAVAMFENKVAPLFKYACIDYDVKQTERAAHGVEIAEKLPLGVYDCVVTVGGDGSLCEIFQGLMKRTDWKDAIRQPLGVIPGGSGNGLFASMMHDLGERFKTSSAAYVLAKGQPQPLDLTAVRNPHGDTMYSFLSTEWALIADVDVESEKLRALGGTRFTVTTIQHIFFKRREYEGEVWYLEDDPESEVTLVPHSADGDSPRPGFDLFSNLADGAEASDGSKAKWKKVQGAFHLVWVMNATHAASDALLAPGAGVNDGYNYLVMLNASHPRKELVTTFLRIDSGKHVDQDSVEFIKTRAFKIVPARSDDLICVDGEVFKGPVEAQVHHNVARIVTLASATVASVVDA